MMWLLHNGPDVSQNAQAEISIFGKIPIPNALCPLLGEPSALELHNRLHMTDDQTGAGAQLAEKIGAEGGS